MNSSIMIAIVQKDRQISTFWFHKQNVQGKLNMQLQVKCIQHKKKLLKRKKWWKTCASLIPISEVVLNEKFYQRIQFKNFAIVLYRYTKKCQHSSMNEKKTILVLVIFWMISLGLISSSINIFCLRRVISEYISSLSDAVCMAIKSFI